MSHQSFARKYRPQNFKDIAGQSHIVTTLVNSIKSSRIASVYLFTGPRGTGKTSSARILAKALNCAQGPTPDPCNVCDLCREITSGDSLDVIEIDGASNNSVDEVRSLRENVKYSPAKSRYKVYIIDEVHMLSIGAFNALLKTLEEPPAHVVFILATTEVHKIPETVLSRCQRYDFRRAPLKDITDLLGKVAVSESLDLEDGAINQIAASSDGSYRDAESILDKLVSYCGAQVREADVMDILGLVDKSLVSDLVGAAVDRDPARALAIVEKAMNSGYDPAQLVKQLMGHFRNLMLLSAGSEDLVESASSDLERLKEQSAAYPLEDTLRAMRLIAEMESNMGRSSQPRTMIEVMAVRLARMDSSVLLGDILEKLSDLESRLGNSGPSALELPFEGGGANQSVERVGKNPVGHDPVGHDPVGHDPVGHDPVGHDPVGHDPVGHDPVGHDPVGHDPKKGVTESMAAPSDHSDTLQPAPDNVWAAVVEEIRKERKDLNTRMMIMGGQVKVEDGKAVVEFRNGIYRADLEKTENRKLIEDKIKKVLGGEPEITFSFSQPSTDEDAPSNSSSREVQPSLREDVQTALKKYPVLEKALIEFAGQIVSIT